MGPLKHLSTMRCESKNRDFKITSHVSLNRINICKTLAIKSQLRFSRRLQRNVSEPDDLYEVCKEKAVIANELPDYYSYDSLLPFAFADSVSCVNFMTFQNRTLEKNVALMTPNKVDYEMLLIHVIVRELNKNIYIVAKDVTKYTYYEEHYQAYRLLPNYETKNELWRCLSVQDLKSYSISHKVSTGNKREYILKRWI